MRSSKWICVVFAATATVLGACAPGPELDMGVIHSEPTFDKFGNPSCRPGDVPIGGVYTAELAECPVIGAAPAVFVAEIDTKRDSSRFSFSNPRQSDDPSDLSVSRLPQNGMSSPGEAGG